VRGASSVGSQGCLSLIGIIGLRLGNKVEPLLVFANQILMG
jgi:hypothetical protein